MKLWKIMLAALICVLMLSAVAMAAECNHNYVATADTWTVRKPLADGTHRAYTYTTMRCDKCVTATYVKEEAGATGACEMENVGALVPATCEEYGYYNTKCVWCGREGKKNMTAPLGHKDAYKYVKGTCKVKSADVYYCSREGCGEELARVEWDYEDCSYKKVWITEQTCTQDGSFTQVCKVCGEGDGHGVQYVPAKSHDWLVFKTVNPTCSEKGYDMEYCSWCGATRNWNYTDIAHGWQWQNEVAATCAKDGAKAHNKCAYCGALSINGKDIVSADSLVLPKKANGHIVDTTRTVTKHFTDCTANTNYQHAYCKVCGLEFDTPIAPKAHKFPEIKIANAETGVASDCTEKGWGNFACEDCNQIQKFEIAALGHKWRGWVYGEAATCIKAMTATRVCDRAGCPATETITVAPATGHVWVEVKGTDATCTTAGKVDRKCAVCNVVEYGITVPAKGHNLTKVIETVKPTCEAKGYTVYGCSVCDATEKGSYVDALGHNYSWVVVTKPSEAGNGKNEYTCALCKKVADTKTIKYTKMYYNNTMTSFGPMTRELVGGNDWYRVTPVDLTVDGVYTYDLIASNKYVVGKVTITVNAGTLTVSYKANGVDVKDEALLIYASKADLATGTAVTAPVGAAINAAETFGADSKVLVSLILTGDYDAAGKGLVDASAAAGMIANID